MSSAATSDVSAYSYDATLYSPLFYGSKEGSVIETDPTVSATALMHAIGYEYYALEKRFVLIGEETTTPVYERLRRLPIFTSEMVPEAVDATERTFRTASYDTERAITTQNTAVGEFLRGTKKPVPRKTDGSTAGWHRQRDYVGLAPGSTFEFTIWAPVEDAPPKELGFRAGIKRTGEFRAVRREEPVSTVTLNQYLLENVYEISKEDRAALLENAVRYRRGNDIRTNRFHGVDRSWVDDTLADRLVTT